MSAATRKLRHWRHTERCAFVVIKGSRKRKQKVEHQWAGKGSCDSRRLLEGVLRGFSRVVTGICWTELPPV